MENVASTYEATTELTYSWGIHEGSSGIEKMAEASFTSGLSEDYWRVGRGLGELSGYRPGGGMSWEIPGLPRHLTGMLGGGLMGAGLRYGAGWLGSKHLPKSWNRDRLPRTVAILGGLAGASPGAAVFGQNAIQGKPVGDDTLLQMPPNQVNRYLPTKLVYSSGPNDPTVQVDNWDFDPSLQFAVPSAYKKAINHVGANELFPALKVAVSRSGYEIYAAPPAISVDEFNQVLWQDPRVAGRPSEFKGKRAR